MIFLRWVPGYKSTHRWFLLYSSFPSSLIPWLHLLFYTRTLSALYSFALIPLPVGHPSFSILPIIAYPVHSCRRRLVFQTQIWTAALDSVALKCISCKILPFCERVIFRKKRRKQLVRQSCKASVNPKRFRQEKEPNRGKRKNNSKLKRYGQD